MGWFDFLDKKEKVDIQKRRDVNAYFGRHLFTVSYTGEKNTGELGELIKYNLDYASLRHRSWKSYLDSEITQTVINKYVKWVIGSGLKLQSEPVDIILKQNNINVSLPELTRNIEARFRLFCKSENSDYSQINNLNVLANTAFKNSIIGGDVLVILRLENKRLNAQLIDGAHVQTPYFDDSLAKATKLGNTIKNGIEIDNKGRIIAYHVKQLDGTFKRIEARLKGLNLESAFMVYGLGYRIDDNRGIPLISAVLETLAKLDRYKEATVGSAEERAKIVYFIKHGNNSTGENPLATTLAKSFNVDSNQDNPIDINANELANNIAVSTNKQVFNMPNDSVLESLDSKNDLYFKDFYSVNVNAICATIGIPPEVALSKYDSNFSSARAAIKDWEHTIITDRTKFSQQFYQKIFNFWLDVEVLKNNVQAPGYLNAMMSKDEEVLQSYRNARFVGANVPHIDPLKEVNAERAKLGESGKHLPLTTAEASTEALNGGEYDSNVVKYSEELKKSRELEIEPKEITDNNG